MYIFCLLIIYFLHDDYGHVLISITVIASCFACHDFYTPVVSPDTFAGLPDTSDSRRHAYHQLCRHA